MATVLTTHGSGVDPVIASAGGIRGTEQVAVDKARGAAVERLLDDACLREGEPEPLKNSPGGRIVAEHRRLEAVEAEIVEGEVDHPGGRFRREPCPQWGRATA